MDAGRLVLPFIALLAGLLIGVIDLRATEVVVAVGLILVATLALAVASPRQAWLTGLLVGLGIPLLYLMALAFGIRPVDPPRPNLLPTLPALIPASVGAGLGALIGFLLRAS